MLITFKNLEPLWLLVAPSFASLSMGNIEKEFFDSGGVQQLLWLRFLDDIFMIWDDSEEKL